MHLCRVLVDQREYLGALKISVIITVHIVAEKLHTDVTKYCLLQAPESDVEP